MSSNIRFNIFFPKDLVKAFNSEVVRPVLLTFDSDTWGLRDVSD